MPSPQPSPEQDDGSNIPIVRLALVEDRLKHVGAAVDRNHDSQKDMQRELTAKLDQISTKMEATYATKDALAAVDKKVTSILAYGSWTLKAIAGALVTGVAGYLFAHGGAPHP